MRQIICNRQYLADRTVYIDYLRVFAICAVMILHVSEQNWDTTDVMRICDMILEKGERA